MKWHFPDELQYTGKHEWLRREEGGEVVVGITDYAQDHLGDIVFVELPELGKNVGAGESVAVVESVKAVSDVYAPVSGRVVAVNEKLMEQPELANQDPYGEGWMVRLERTDDNDRLLLAVEAYRAVVEEEEKEQ